MKITRSITLDYELNKLLSGVSNASNLIESLLKTYFKTYIKSDEAKLDRELDKAIQRINNGSS